MGRADNLIEQHVKIAELVGQINTQLNSENLKKDAEPIREILSKLTGILKMHLAAEDNALYPALLKDENEDVRKTAEHFMNEMGGIRDAYVSYVDKWHSPQIQENPASFIAETNEVFRVLAERVEREDKELFPLLTD